MVLTAEMMAYRVPGLTLANGDQQFISEPHPILRQLETKCRQGSAREVEQLLGEIGPIPPSDTIPQAALSCLQTAVLHAGQNSDKQVLPSLLLLSNGLLSHYEFSWQLVDSAFRRGDTSLLSTLIEGGWDVNETGGADINMRPLLRHAVNNNNMRTFLLGRGADPMVENPRGTTALETAAGYSSPSVVEDLLAHGGDPTRDDSLLAAVESGRLDNVKILVAKGGADLLDQVEKKVYNSTRPRRTPLDVAEGLPMPGVKVWLLENGATARNMG